MYTLWTKTFSKTGIGNVQAVNLVIQADSHILMTLRQYRTGTVLMEMFQDDPT